MQYRITKEIKMLLYLVYDSTAKTVSYPLTAPNAETAYQALQELNPENLSDLIIHPLLTLNSPLDLFLLSLDENKTLPAFLINRSDSVTPESTQQVADALDLLRE